MSVLCEIGAETENNILSTWYIVPLYIPEAFYHFRNPMV